MQESQNKKKLNEFEEKIDLRELIYVLWQGKWIIFSITTIVSILAVFYSLSLPNIYKTNALLVPAGSYSTPNNNMGGVASLAGLAGISLPTIGGENNSKQAISKISSLSFFENNLLPNIFLPDLFAVQFWDNLTNEISYDENIYNINTNSWVRDTSESNSKIPSGQESYREFSSHLSLEEDKKTGFITLGIKHKSPFIAKKWTELLINQINLYYKEKDKAESERALSYLNEKFLMTELSEIKQVIAQLMQEETKKLTLIEAKQAYVFDYIDPPAVMEKKFEPNRAFICILSALIGGIFSVLIVLFRHYWFQETSDSFS